MKKNQNSLFRLEAIKKLITEQSIFHQNQLVDLLKEKYFIETNQAIVSRDLRKLGVTKKILNGNMVYEISEVNVQSEIFKLALVSIENNETMIVIKTHPGLSAFVGDQLDQCQDLDILGCLAGENVIFVIPKKISKINEITDTIRNKFYLKKSK